MIRDLPLIVRIAPSSCPCFGEIGPKLAGGAIDHAQGGLPMTPAIAMKAALWMTLLSTVVLFAAIYGAQKYYGVEDYKVTGRNVDYTAADVTALAKNQRTAAGYVVPILFPLDLLLLASLAAFMTTWSVHFAGAAGIPAPWVWLVIVVPVIYMAADLSENTLLARMLTDPATISERAVAVAQATTQLKLAASFFGLLQTVTIIALGLLLRR
jgi:hypothetical protein